MAKKKGKFEIEGLDKLMRNINQEIKTVEGRSMKGFIEAVRHIREEMDTLPPLIPVGKTGHLRQSWFTNTWKAQGRFGILSFGFNANYAVFVHEMVGQHINWNRPNAGARFLYTALDRNYRNGKILQIVRDNSAIK